MATSDAALLKQIDAHLAAGEGKKGAVYGGKKATKQIKRLARKAKRRGGKLAVLAGTGNALESVRVGEETRARGVRISDLTIHAATIGGKKKRKSTKKRKARKSTKARKSPAKKRKTAKARKSPAKRRKSSVKKGSAAAKAWGKKMAALRKAKKSSRSKAAKKAARTRKAHKKTPYTGRRAIGRS